MKRLIFTTYILLSTLNLGAQSPPEIPAYEINSAEDYTSYNDLVLECCRWLREVPMEGRIKERNEIADFIYNWIKGCEDAFVLMDERLTPYHYMTPQLTFIYYVGSINYQLENGICATERDDLIESSVAGIEACIDYYNANRDYFKPDKDVKKLEKLRKKGNLRKYVSTIIPTGINELPGAYRY